MKFKSPVYSQASGSIAGITYSHNRGGMYTRQRVVPTNPASEYQSAVRSYVAALVAAWSSVLSDAQRAAWDLYAESVELPDTLGDTRNVGGVGMYVRSNVPRLQAGLTRVDDGPTVFSLPEVANIALASASEASQELSVTFLNTDDWAGEDGAALLVYVSRPANPGVNFFKGPYRLAAVIEGDSGTPPTSPTAVTAPFAITAAQKVFAKFNITRADGRYSSPFRAGVVIGS
ncbi:MAG: hypothetical protein PVG30_09545 [Gammaproteobacteria bacterium]|jgi:hypothetical protein